MQYKSFGNSVHKTGIKRFLEEEGITWEEIEDINVETYDEEDSYGDRCVRAEIVFSWHDKHKTPPRG